MTLIAALDRYFNITDSLAANGCEHGVKPAAACPNRDCDARQAHVAWRAIEAQASSEPVAYLHIRHEELGQITRRLSFEPANAFGEPGRDYSAEWPVTVTPLYDALAAAREPE